MFVKKKIVHITILFCRAAAVGIIYCTTISIISVSTADHVQECITGLQEELVILFINLH